MAKLTEEQVCSVMSMKSKEIRNWYDLEDGVTLVVTFEGAQTLILPDGTKRAVHHKERVFVPTKGGGRDEPDAPIKVSVAGGSKKS